MTTLSIPQTRPRTIAPAVLDWLRNYWVNNDLPPNADLGLCGVIYAATGNVNYAQPCLEYLENLQIPENQWRPDANGSDMYRNHRLYALLYDWCYGAMSPDQQERLATKYNTWVFSIKQQVWGGPGMSNNDYFWANFSNEVNWAIATWYENPDAAALLDWTLTERWQNGWLPYAAGYLGGCPPEGTEYGPVTLGAYAAGPFLLLAELGRPLLTPDSWHAAAVWHLIYWVTPMPTYRPGMAQPYYQLFPFGQDEKDGGHPQAAQVYLGDFLTVAAYLFQGTPAGQAARWWLDTVQPPVTAWLDWTTPGLDQPPAPAPELPLDYYAAGPGYLYARSPGGETAVMLQMGLAGAPGQIHQDAGSFQVWRKGRWLSKESTGYILQLADCGSHEPRAHNCLLVGGQGCQPAWWEGWTNVLRLQSHPQFAFGAVAQTGVMRTRRPDVYESHTVSAVREFLFLRAPWDVLLILDRIEADDPATERRFCVHAPTQPSVLAPDILQWTNGDQALTARLLGPEFSTTHLDIVDEGNVDHGNNEPSFFQWRADIVDNPGTAQSYFLVALCCHDNDRLPAVATLTDRATDWLITLTRPGQGPLEIVLSKGMESAGGSVGGVALRKDVQPFAVTAAGPLWGE